MKTALMDGIEEGIKKHLESLDVDVAEGFVFFGHKHLVNIINEDMFNQVAQASKIKHIKDNEDNLTFYIRYDDNPWIIVLTDKRKEFLETYGGKYTII